MGSFRHLSTSDKILLAITITGTLLTLRMTRRTVVTHTPGSEHLSDVGTPELNTQSVTPKSGVQPEPTKAGVPIQVQMLIQNMPT